MNFLAHLYLAEADPAAKVGCLMPDLARPRHIPDTLPPATLAAVRQHRAIDAFTDTHAIVAQSKARLRHNHGHFTAVIVDVLYDHILARDWNAWRDDAARPGISLADFIASVHHAFTTYAHLMPATMRPPIQRMIQQQWLASYVSLEGIEARLKQMSQRFMQRFERDVKLETAVDDFRQHDAALTTDFNVFFPQLRIAAILPKEHSAALRG